MGSYPNFIKRSPSGLVDALCARVTKVLEPFWQEGAFGEDRAPFVHAQFLPVSKTASKEPDKTTDCPFVQIICTKGIVSNFHPGVLGSEMEIQFYFNAYSKEADMQGWRLPEAMLWYVMQDLCANKIENGYLLQAEMKWTVLDSKEPPYFTALLETKWRGSPPAIETPFEGVNPLEKAKAETEE